MAKLDSVFEYAIVGAGPAAICAIASLLQSGVSGSKIIWVDPAFSVGDFGGLLSSGSSVPGNTRVAEYRRVNREIFAMLPDCAPLPGMHFALDSLAPDFVCSLKVAAAPLQHISDRLRVRVKSLAGKVSCIDAVPRGLQLEIIKTRGTSVAALSRRVILATGACAKKLALPAKYAHLPVIDAEIAFIKSRLASWLKNNPGVKKVAVAGSSHSAALAVMHLVNAGIAVKQFMNKAYLYATDWLAPDGARHTRYDNTGLKGEVAKFTRALLAGDPYLQDHRARLTRHVAADTAGVARLLECELEDCSHVLAAIGYETAPALEIEHQPLSAFTYDSATTGFREIAGVNGFGIGFPLKVTAPSGETEFAVGVGKFWTAASSKKILDFWKLNVAGNPR